MEKIDWCELVEFMLDHEAFFPDESDKKFREVIKALEYAKDIDEGSKTSKEKEYLDCIYWLVAQYHVDKDNLIVGVCESALEHAVHILKGNGLASGPHCGAMHLKKP